MHGQRLTRLGVKTRNPQRLLRIFETRVAQCRAKAANKGENPYTARLTELQDAYQALAGRMYPLPECDDL